MQANIFLLLVYTLYADQYKLLKKTRHFNFFWLFLISN